MLQNLCIHINPATRENSINRPLYGDIFSYTSTLYSILLLMPHDVMEACIHNNHLLTIDDIYTCNKVHLSDMLILLCEWQRTTMDGWSEYGSIVIYSTRISALYQQQITSGWYIADTNRHQQNNI